MWADRRGIDESLQRLYLKCDKLYKMKTDNPSTLRKYLVAHKVHSSKVGDANDAAYEIHIDRTGGSTWEWNPLVNLAARQGRFRCVSEYAHRKL